MIYFALAGYCFAAYHARGLEIDRQVAKEAERLSQREAVKLASKHMEDRRRR